MSRVPVWRLRKEQIVWLGTHTCKHGHTYLEHYNCYLEEQSSAEEKIGFLDIETSNLDANYGICFSYCIKEMGSNKIYSRVVTKKELKKDLDKGVMKQLLKDLQKFDRVVTYYGTGFDIPFIRTRCIAHNLDNFPEYGAMFHKDVYYIIRNKFKLNRNSQEIACRTLLGNTEKNHIKAEYWIKALQGDQKSLNYILDHNKRDVRDLEKLYNKVINFHKTTRTSI